MRRVPAVTNAGPCYARRAALSKYLCWHITITQNKNVDIGIYATKTLFREGRPLGEHDCQHLARNSASHRQPESHRAPNDVSDHATDRDARGG